MEKLSAARWTGGPKTTSEVTCIVGGISDAKSQRSGLHGLPIFRFPVNPWVGRGGVRVSSTSPLLRILKLVHFGTVPECCNALDKL